jgi:hypothetical protein
MNSCTHHLLALVIDANLSAQMAMELEHTDIDGTTVKGCGSRRLELAIFFVLQ